MNIKAFFPCGGGSNLILGMGREDQIFFLRIPATVKFVFTKLSKNNMGCHGGGCVMPLMPP